MSVPPASPVSYLKLPCKLSTSASLESGPCGVSPGGAMRVEPALYQKNKNKKKKSGIFYPKRVIRVAKEVWRLKVCVVVIVHDQQKQRLYFDLGALGMPLGFWSFFIGYELMFENVCLVKI